MSENKIDARFIHYLTHGSGTSTSVVYLCEDPGIGIGWRLRRIREVRVSGEMITDVEDVSISGHKAYEILSAYLITQLMKETQKVAEEHIDEHFGQVECLLEEISGIAKELD